MSRLGGSLMNIIDIKKPAPFKRQVNLATYKGKLVN